MDDFEILKEDSHYPSWTHTFNAIAAIQDIAEPLHPDYDESKLQSDLQRLLHKKKKEYIWGLWLKILQNPFGKTCVSDQKSNKNPFIVWKKHHQMHTDSPSQMYASSASMKDIVSLSLKTFVGTRVEFVTEFFDKVRQFNEYAEEEEFLGYIILRGLLATAVVSDKDLPGSFAACKPTGNRTVKIQLFKDHMISEASLYDSK